MTGISNKCKIFIICLSVAVIIGAWIESWVYGLIATIGVLLFLCFDAVSSGESGREVDEREKAKFRQPPAR